jgi:hypothetical protein
MRKLAKAEAMRGTFQTMEGDIDNRSAALKDIELPNGFKIDCGLKGSKLSGG